MTPDQRQQKCGQFADLYRRTMRSPRYRRTERLLIIENLAHLAELTKPDMIPIPAGTRPVELPDGHQDKLGMFRDPERDRRCVTADMDIIRFYINELNEEPPSFLQAGPQRKLYHDPEHVNVAVLTAGGIAPGLNTVVETIVEKHFNIYELKPGVVKGKVLGCNRGFAGLQNEDFVSLDVSAVKGWCRQGGSELGVGRDKLDVERCLRVLEKHQIDILYVIGGNGSVSAARDLAEAALKKELRLSIGLVPRTMDNDVLWVWNTIGFDSALEEASEIVGILHAEARSNRRVCVIQLFGAKSGYIAACAALATGLVDAVLIPEEDFEVRKVAQHIRGLVAGRLCSRCSREPPYALLLMAESARGIEDRDGKWYRWLAETPDQRTANFLRIQQEIQQELDCVGLGRHKVFGNQPQHVIRSVAPGPSDQAYARRLADSVVDVALAGYTNFMVTWWLTEFVVVPLKFAAKNGLSKEGYKIFPTGGIFWRVVLRSTGQPPFLSDEARERVERGEVQDVDLTAEGACAIR